MTVPRIGLTDMDAPLCLYRKYRPKRFSEVVGQTIVKNTLLNAVRTTQFSHAYLFSGPRGTGKTTAARLLGKALNCLSHDDGEPCCHCENCLAVDEGSFLDLIEIDAASNSLIDDIRNLREKVQYVPVRGRYKVYIIDEAHQLRGAAAHAFLKTLEEPPAHVIFVLATTEPHKFLETILSRCQRFDFKRIGVADIIGRLRFIADTEKIDVSDECLRLIARAAEGGMRDAISLMDQVESFEGGRISPETLEELLGTVREDVCTEIVRCLIMGDREGVLALGDRLMVSGRDPYQLVLALTEHVRGMIRAQLGVGTVDVFPRQDAPVSLTVQDLTDMMNAFFVCLRTMRLTGEESIALDLLFLDLIDKRQFSLKPQQSPVRPQQSPEKNPEQKRASRSTPVPDRPPAPAAEAVTPSTRKPVVEPTAEPIIEPVIEPDVKTAVKPVVMPVVEETASPPRAPLTRPAKLTRPEKKAAFVEPPVEPPVEQMTAPSFPMEKELDGAAVKKKRFAKKVTKPKAEKPAPSVQAVIGEGETAILELSQKQSSEKQKEPLEEVPEKKKKNLLTQVMDELKARDKMRIHALLKEAIGMNVEDQTVRVYFFKKYSFHMDTLRENSKRLVLEEVVGKILGGSFRVEPTEHEADTDSAAPQKQAEVNKTIVDHPTVKKVLEIFGGEIVE